jgi:NB-ARC domain
VLPFPQNPLFTGRDTHLQRLEQLLQENGSVVVNQSISINGLGGIGKTQLALEYAHRQYKKRYRAIFWVNAANEAAIEESCIQLARHLNLSEQREGKPDLTGAVEAVKQWLESHTKWLLVLDNVDDLSVVVTLLPIVREGHVLLTTRLHAVGNIAMPLELDKMEPVEGMLFLLLRSRLLEDKAELNTITPDLHTVARTLVDLLGAHPLALDQAGAFIEETGTPITEYLRLYEQQRRALLDRRGSLGYDHPEAVTTTLELNLTKACNNRQLAMDIMYFCSFIDSSGIPEMVLHRIDGITFDALAFNEAIGDLQTYSLIKRSPLRSLLSIHPLVQEVIQYAMPLHFREQWFWRVQRTLSKARREPISGLLDHVTKAVSRAEPLGLDKKSFMTLFIGGRPVFYQEERDRYVLEHLGMSLLMMVKQVETRQGVNHSEPVPDLPSRVKALYKAVYDEVQAEMHNQVTNTPTGYNPLVNLSAIFIASFEAYSIP